MRLPVWLTGATVLLASTALAQQVPPAMGLAPEQEAQLARSQQKFEFQSDIARLMRVVVSHLYHDRDVFLRELISNSGDALEKLRFASLTNSKVLDTAPALNISIVPDRANKRLVIRDSGVGMTRDELQKNLGTIARSGTADFLAKLEASAGGEGSNLIGQFGLGFYSSFLVADRVTVASKSNDDKKQWIFESEADKGEFRIAEDPRGNSLGRGTEVVLHLKDDAAEFLDSAKLRTLINTHSAFSTSVPIYLWTDNLVEVPNEKAKKTTDEDVTVEDEVKDDEPKTKQEIKSDWMHINTKGPVWTRDPKDVTDEEYNAFYGTLTTTQDSPTGWVHFKGDAGRTSFHALIYMPTILPQDFYAKSYQQTEAVRLYVRRVLITKEPAPDFLPKWLNWIKVVIDADDLPLNVGRDSLQTSRSLRQIQSSIIKKLLDHLANMAEKEPEKYTALWKTIGVPLKVGSVEDKKNRDRVNKLLRFTSSVSDQASLEQYVARRKKGQKQIFFMAGAGLDPKDLGKSPFVEKLVARGYEVLYLTDPMDEMITSSLGNYEGMKFQDVAKKGLSMGDEEELQKDKEELEAFKEQYEPLTSWIKKEFDHSVSEVIISNRLVTSPCAVVTDSYAWTGNMERLMAAQNNRESNMVLDFIRNAKRTFEINPKHPLIEGLLKKVEDVEGDPDAAEELKETVGVLWDTALVKSGFTVKDTNAYFDRVETLLRRSLGVSESAQVKDTFVAPAPPVEEGPFKLEDAEETIDLPDMPKNDADWADWKDLRKKLEKDAPEGEAGQEIPPVVGQPPVEQISLGMEGETDPETYVRDEL